MSGAGGRSRALPSRTGYRGKYWARPARVTRARIGIWVWDVIYRVAEALIDAIANDPAAASVVDTKRLRALLEA